MKDKRKYVARVLVALPGRSGVTIDTDAVAPQVAKVLRMMGCDGHVTRLSAAHLGIPNVTARIADIRLRLGVDVDSVEATDLDGRSYTRWSLPRGVEVQIHEEVTA